MRNVAKPTKGYLGLFWWNGVLWLGGEVVHLRNPLKRDATFLRDVTDPLSSALIDVRATFDPNP